MYWYFVLSSLVPRVIVPFKEIDEVIGVSVLIISIIFPFLSSSDTPVIVRDPEPVISIPLLSVPLPKFRSEADNAASLSIVIVWACNIGGNRAKEMDRAKKVFLCLLIIPAGGG